MWGVTTKSSTLQERPTIPYTSVPFASVLTPDCIKSNRLTIGLQEVLGNLNLHVAL